MCLGTEWGPASCRKQIPRPNKMVTFDFVLKHEHVFSRKKCPLAKWNPAKKAYSLNGCEMFCLSSLLRTGFSQNPRLMLFMFPAYTKTEWKEGRKKDDLGPQNCRAVRSQSIAQSDGLTSGNEKMMPTRGFCVLGRKVTKTSGYSKGFGDFFLLVVSASNASGVTLYAHIINCWQGYLKAVWVFTIP